MTNTKARRERDLIDEVVALKRDKAKQYGRARQDASATSAQGVPLGGSGKKGSSDSNANNDIYLSTIGGTMMGPLAFYLASATIADGVIDISKASGNYSSRMLVIGEGGVADDLEVILNASFAGQILFFQPIQAITLQSYLKTATAWANGTSYSVGDVILSASQRYTCHTAHTAATATNKPGTGSDWNDFWYRNNIRVTGATERVVAIDEIIMLQYDSTDSVWTVISGGGTSGSGGAGLGDTNVWTASNTFQSAVSMTGASVIIGDASTDLLYINSTISGNVDFGGNDIENIDRLDFQVTGQRLNSTSSSIQYEVPSGDVHKFLVSSVSKVTIDSNGLNVLTGDLDMAYGTTINFNSSVTTSRTGGAAAALPSAPVGYFLIKFGGNFRYVPYYS